MRVKPSTRIETWRASHPVLASYCVALVAVLLATLLAAAVFRMGGVRSHPLIAFAFPVAVLASAWWGGYGPGIMACLLCFSVIPTLLLPKFSITSIDPARFALTILLSLLVSRVASSRRQVESTLLEANKQLEQKVRDRTVELQTERDRYQALAGHLLKLQESERRHLSREIHDSLGQELTGIKFQVQAIEMRHPEVALPKQIVVALDQLTAKLRKVAAGLRPPILDHFSLPEALEWLVDEFSERTGLNCRVEIADAIPQVSDEVKMAMFRVCQEALTNAARHAEPSSIVITLRAKPELTLSIHDDGVGFDTGRPSASLGLLGMRERAEAIGGSFSIESKPGQGTKVSLVLPVECAAVAASV
jgi:signal transduction histidine kinase